MNAPTMAIFTPADGAARWTKGLLAATLVLSGISVISGLLQIDLLSRAATGISETEAAANDARQQLIGILQLLVYVGTVVAFLTWFYRVHSNLNALGGRELKYSSGWAIGGFFVPFLNLVRPLQVMREVWHASDPSGLERDTAPSGPSVRNQLGMPALVGWWWALFLVTGILGRFVWRMNSAESPTLDQLQELSATLVIADLVELPSGFLAIAVVARITKWQRQRHDRIRRSAGTASQEVATGAMGVASPSLRENPLPSAHALHRQ
jgi:hypothetical protein